MLFKPSLGINRQRPGNRQQPRLAITMPAPINGDGLEPEIDHRKMSAGGDAPLAQDRGGE